MDLPLLKRGEIEIPKRWHMGKNADRHLLDVFRDWRDPPGIKLLMGLLKYNPAVRLTAEEALASDYFSTLVSQRTSSATTHCFSGIMHTPHEYIANFVWVNVT